MKRMLALTLALAMVLSLAACGKKEETPAPAPQPAPSAPVEEDISLAELNVEFVAGSRDTAQLMKLKGEFPEVFQKALAEFDVDVEKVNVTFGASADATAKALADGNVQVAFLPARSYYEHGGSMFAVALGLAAEEETEIYSIVMPVELGELIADGEEGAPETDGAEVPEDIIPGFDPLEALSAIPAEELVCAVPVQDEVALRALEYMLAQLRPDIDFAAVENIREYTTFTSNLFDADLVVRRGMGALTDSRHPILTGIALGGSVVAVSAEDEIIAGEDFRAAAADALEEIQGSEVWRPVLAYYGDGVYLPIQPEEEALTRWLYGLTEEKPLF